MIPAGFVQELLARVDIVDVIGRHVQLRKTGANLVGLCPFHAEKSPSFTVSPTKQFYHCFGCGASGDAIRFLTEHLGLGFVEAVHELAQQVGLQVPQDDASPQQREQAQRRREHDATLASVLKTAADHYRQQLKASPRAIEYLKRRGLTGEIARAFALGYAPDSWRGLASVFPRYDDPLLAEAGLVVVHDDGGETKRYDRFRDRIMFPIRNVKGDVIGFGARVIDRGEPKYLNSPETPLFHKGRELYGLFEARTALRERGVALVVEGYMDVVALAQLGLPNAVATLGTACTPEHVAKLLRFTDRVVFSFDGDAAGRRAAVRALEAALPHASDTRSFRFLFLPPEHDPDSYVRAHGREAFERLMAQATPLSRLLVDVAQADCDLATAEGRARMLAQAQPLWSQLPDGALRRQLLGELARLGGLGVDELASLWRVGASPTPATRIVDARPAPAAPRRGGVLTRQPPRRPEDRALQLLLAHADWWDRLSAEAHELLHALPPPHGALVAWLERELAEHGARPWAVLRRALADDAALADAGVDTAAWLDDVDAADAQPDDLQRAVDHLLERQLKTQLDAAALDAQRDPQLLPRYRDLLARMAQVKKRLAGQPA
ncbi:DNA primase [Calidifontimicrobium sp. SYSU G02091]|uniref:DNA primase n=1 Tax=Calidifontimicrobium sp. SYSU G02091 TaxID=2926421 RepID=UPI001F52E58B|nr:DNA primase [Calidifontimicrobium sp. SYSU G02091]MCI1191007.1 DNA primase [Calidifontimicrobium sp. SYSU G02091]